MLTINTNLSSLTAQRSLSNATNGLNQALERLSTGFKINHACDNAANYSISETMSANISSWEVAENNVVMGIDLLATAEGNLDIINGHLYRIRDLCEQAANGTYGSSSRMAIQLEIDQRVEEIERIISITEYNGIKLFENDDSTSNSTNTVESTSTPVLTSASATPLLATTSTGVTASNGPNGKFIDDIVEETPDINITNPDELYDALRNYTKVGIGNAATLAKLAEIVNNGTTCDGKTIILTSDIDLSAYQTGTGWTPIGTGGIVYFTGNFNGNGHVVSNLYINNPGSDVQGLFGCIVNGEIKNVGIENCNITGESDVGGLVGDYLSSKTITNCYATGDVTGTDNIGGLVGSAPFDFTITDSYSTVNVTGNSSSVGGLVGKSTSNITITGSYTTGDVTGTDNVGGLVGSSSGNSTITGSYTTGNVTGTGNYVGGLAGEAMGTITGSYTTGNVTGTGNYVGGLLGSSSYDSSSTITSCHSEGDVTGTGNYVGGLVGRTEGTITGSHATGTVSGVEQVGGLAGNANSISDSYATGDISGEGAVGGLIGQAGTITNCYAEGTVTGTDGCAGGLAGIAYEITNSYATGDVTGTDNVGGLVGEVESAISNCHSEGDVTGNDIVGGLAGNLWGNITESYSKGSVSGNSDVGGLVGRIYALFDNLSFTKSTSYAPSVTGNSKTGSFIGSVFLEYEDPDGSGSGTLTISNCVTTELSGLNKISGAYKSVCDEEWTESIVPLSYDMTEWNNNITYIDPPDPPGPTPPTPTEELKTITLQVGIYSGESNQISFTTGFDLGELEFDVSTDSSARACLDVLDEKLAITTGRQTEFGAVQNRLDSTLSSIEISHDNLVSSLSSIKDADIAEESSKYIQQQILQEASATLLATANQQPSIALSLI